MEGMSRHGRISRKTMPGEFQKRDDRSIESLKVLSEIDVALIAFPPGRAVKISEFQATFDPAPLYDVVVKRRTALVVESFYMLSDRNFLSNAPLCHSFVAFLTLSG
jgi:hypothetical protein